MATLLSVPGKSVSLLGSPGLGTDKDASATGGAVPQAMQLDLEEGVLQNILRTARSGGKGVHVSFGKTITLNFGNRSKQLTATPQSHPTELYSYDTEAPDEIAFAGMQSHRLALKKAQDSFLGADAALAKLQMSLATHEKEKQARQIQLADGANPSPGPSKRDAAQKLKTSNIKKHAPSQGSVNGIARPTLSNSSPAPGNSAQISAAPTSVPSAMDGKVQKVRAIRIPLIHFLAVRPVSEKYLAQTLKCTQEECKEVLERVGRPYRLDTSKWDLTDKAYRELDVYRFKYPSEDDRQLAIDRAVTAYDRMRLSHDDTLWQKLLPVHERGKRKVLSKLNLREGAKAQKAMTPRINVHSTEDTATGGITPSNDSDARPDRLAPSDAEPMARSKTNGSVIKQNVSDKEVKGASSKASPKPSKVQKTQKPKGKASPKLTANAKKGPKKGGPAKVVAKSSEFVRDSDEDEDEEMTDASALGPVLNNTKTAAVGAKKLPANVDLAKPPSSDPSKKSNSTNNAKDQKKSKASNVDVATDSKIPKVGNTKDAINPKKPAINEVEGTKDQRTFKTPHSQSGGKRPPTSSSSSSESRYKPSDSSQSSTAASKTLSRQRTTSSPHKPSPLGSSPPANASDLDNHGRTVSSTSSTSTPLIFQSHGTKQATPKPQPNHPEQVNKMAERLTKRKADEIDSDSDDDANTHKNSSAKGRVPEAKRPKTSPMSPPASDSSSSLSYEARLQQAVDEAVRFKKYYAKYYALYQEVVTLPKDVPNSKFDRLMQMHEKLAQMKADIAQASGP